MYTPPVRNAQRSGASRIKLPSIRCSFAGAGRALYYDEAQLFHFSGSGISFCRIRQCAGVPLSGRPRSPAAPAKGTVEIHADKGRYERRNSGTSGFHTRSNQLRCPPSVPFFARTEGIRRARKVANPCPEKSDCASSTTYRRSDPINPSRSYRLRQWMSPLERSLSKKRTTDRKYAGPAPG